METWDKETCITCGIQYLISAEYKAVLIDKGKTFYCPNGHGQSYKQAKIKDLEKLKARIKSQENTIEDLHAKNRELYNKNKELVKQKIITENSYPTIQDVSKPKKTDKKQTKNRHKKLTKLNGILIYQEVIDFLVNSTFKINKKQSNTTFKSAKGVIVQLSNDTFKLAK